MNTMQVEMALRAIHKFHNYKCLIYITFITEFENFVQVRKISTKNVYFSKIVFEILLGTYFYQQITTKFSVN